MKLDSFKELLLKKSDDTNLNTLIKFLRDDSLFELVSESLEKMADASHQGAKANQSVIDFATTMDPEHEPHMIHDALSHHATNYKAALAADRKDLANKHAKQIFNIMNLAKKTEPHSDGKLSVEAVAVQPWERHANTKLKPGTDGTKDNHFVTNTKNWGHKESDFSFLQKAPHHSRLSEVQKHGHNGAYPLEQIRINGKYLDIQDKDPSELKGYESHPFDHHPVLEHYKEAGKNRDQNRDNEYLAQKDEYSNSDHMNKYFDKHDALRSANPEAYATRGSKPSSPVHKEVDRLDLGPINEPSQVKVNDAKSPISSITPKSSKDIVNRKSTTSKAADVHQNIINTLRSMPGLSDAEKEEHVNRYLKSVNKIDDKSSFNDAHKKATSSEKPKEVKKEEPVSKEPYTLQDKDHANIERIKSVPGLSDKDKERLVNNYIKSVSK